MSITVDNITVAYDKKLALYNSSFKLKSGSISALVGPNGGGKSTLFKAIMGFVKPQEGRVLINNLSPKIAQKKNMVAYVPQWEEVDWNFPVSVLDVVMMGRYGYMNVLRIPRVADKEIVRESLDRVEMLEYKNRQIGELSGGQKKRTFLARALAQESQIILLDEPFTGVDVKTEKAIIDVLIELRNRGKTILLSTHDLASVATFCDQVVLLNRTVFAYGPTLSVFTQENVTMTFGGMSPNFNFLKS